MTNSNFDALPLELQQRINQIVGATTPTEPQQTPAPVPAPRPSLMDHTIALRQEVDALRRGIKCFCTSNRSCWPGSRATVSIVLPTNRNYKLQRNASNEPGSRE